MLQPQNLDELNNNTRWMLRCEKNFSEFDFHKYMCNPGLIYLCILFALLVSSKITKALVG